LTSASVGRVRSRPFDELRAARDVVLRGQADADAQRAFATILGSSGGAMDPRRAYLAGQVEGNPWVYRSLVALRESATISNVTVGVGSFDTHYLGQLTSWDQQTRSLWAVTQAIAEFDRAFPGHGILIVINTEFGRMHEAGGLGSGHYTDGYGAVVLHPTALSGDRYLGVTTTGSLPVGAFGPAYLRNAIEAYMGLDPVEYDGSDYGDGARLSAHGQVFAVDGTLPAPPVLPTGAAAGGAACPS
ncbi:MAG TPA: hypothetical protein PKA64_23545, partial [Myxococcota bacterium]|nr:hypothetical protein [Myxococcota bacterium]